MDVLVLLHTELSAPGRIAPSLSELGARVFQARYCLGEALPRDIAEFDAMVVLGGPMSCHDPALSTERDLIDQYLSTGKPFFGVCLGAQLLNLAYGGQVEPCPHGQVQMGWHPLLGLDADFDGLDQVYQWHSDWMEVPSALSVTARDDAGRVQGIRCGEHHGVQFHPEADASLRQQWLDRAAHKLIGPGAQPANLHQSLGRDQDPIVSRWLDGFLARQLV